MRPFSSVTSHISRYEIQFEKRLLCDGISDNKWKKEAKIRGCLDPTWTDPYHRHADHLSTKLWNTPLTSKGKWSSVFLLIGSAPSRVILPAAADARLTYLTLVFPFVRMVGENMNTYSCTLHITSPSIHSLCGCISRGNGFDIAGLSLIN